jgi:hypothetical protein
MTGFTIPHHNYLEYFSQPMQSKNIADKDDASKAEFPDQTLPLPLVARTYPAAL